MSQVFDCIYKYVNIISYNIIMSYKCAVQINDQLSKVNMRYKLKLFIRSSGLDLVQELVNNIKKQTSHCQASARIFHHVVFTHKIVFKTCDAFACFRLFTAPEVQEIRDTTLYDVILATTSIKENHIQKNPFVFKAGIVVTFCFSMSIVSISSPYQPVKTKEIQIR